MKQSNISKLRSQAAKALRWQRALNTSRAETKRPDTSSSGIHSVRTWNENICALAKVADDMGLHRLKQIDHQKAIDFLIKRVKLGLSDKSISRDRVALERFLGRRLPCYQDLLKMDQEPALKKKWMKNIMNFLQLKAGDPRTPLGQRAQKNPVPKGSGIGKNKTSKSRPGSNSRLKDVSRAYSDSQIKEIALSFDKESDRIAILLMRDAGLRVHEMHTLRRTNEGKPLTAQRDWRKDRHLHREAGVKYLVTGKGGLTREIVISQTLVTRLEALRNPKPVKVKDRGVNYRQRYNITAGNKLSQKFTRASKECLGFSTGAHGLRHSYAQARMAHLISKGQTPWNAQHIVSQELGHMRASITKTYLR